MLRHAERMEHEALSLERRIFGDASASGGLRISASDWFSRRVLAPVLASFAIAHPEVTVEVLADSRLLDLSRQEADLVFRFVPFDSAAIVQRRLVTIRYGLYASRAYLDARPLGAESERGTARGGGSGEGHSLVTMDRAFDVLPDVAWLRARFPAARYAIRSNSRDVQAEACLRGAGLAVLPRVIGDELALERLVIGDEPPGRVVWLGYHRDLGRLGRLRALVEHVRSAIPKTL